jgi:hypothetical protein
VLGRARRAHPEALEHGLHHGIQLQAGLHVQLGGEPHLRVHDAVGREVLCALGRHADQRVRRLHHPDRVAERLQVTHQRPRMRRCEEPPAELGRIHRRQVAITHGIGELDDRRRPQSAVEMVVQEHLRGIADGVDGERRRHPATLEHAPYLGASGRESLLRTGHDTSDRGAADG